MNVIGCLLLVGLFLVGPFASGYAAAVPTQTISILDVGDTGSTADGTIFVGDPNPSPPATGTGVFQPFLRTQRSSGGGGGVENGFNTDASNPSINFNTKEGIWTHSVQFSDLTPINGYYWLSVDANQYACATCPRNQINITELEIYIGSDPNLANPEATGTGVNGTGYTGTPFNNLYDSQGGGTAPSLLTYAPVWTLDSALNGDVTIVLQASICDTNGQCGSGHGDLGVMIPVRLLGSHSPTDYFVLYTEYSHGNDGFEEWKFFDTPRVPEPASLALLTSGLVAVTAWAAVRRR